MNRIKEFYNDKYGMLITLSWILLIICLVIKLFGGNLFELGTDNEKFIAFCNYVDNHQWLKMILACGIYIGTGYPVLCIMLNKGILSLKENLIFIPLMVTKSILGWYILWLAYILDIFIIILIPLVLRKFKNWKIVILGNILVFLFQLILIIIRNLSGGLNSFDTFIEQSIIQIDYFLMIILFYLYVFKRKRKEDK